MGVIRNLIIRAGADFSGLRRDLQNAQRNMDDFKRGIGSAVKGIAFALAGLGAGLGIQEATKSAMDVEAAMQQVNRTMGNSAAAFTEWANSSAAAFNLSKSDAIKYGAVYSNLLSGFSKDTTETMKNTEALLKASGVVASATGRSMTDVMERIRSGMLGNTESIEDLGINVNIAMIESTNAFKKFADGKSWDKLSFQVQQQIRLFAILEQSSKKYGDALADNTNTRMGMFVMQLKNVQLSLGQAFLPILNVVLPILTSLVTGLARVMSIFAQFSQALFGKADVGGTAQQTSAVSGLGDAYEEAGKKAKNSVAGFDEVNTLGDSSGGGGSGGSGIPTAVDPALLSGMGEATDKVSEKVQAMADKVKKAFAGMRTVISEHKDIIIAALAGLAVAFAGFAIAANWTTIMATLRAAFVGLGAAIAAIDLPIALAIAAIAGLVAAFTYFYRTNDTFKGVVDGALQKIGEVALWLWKEVLVPFGEFYGKVFVGYFTLVGTIAKWLWQEVLVPFGTWFGKVFVGYWEAVSKAAEWLWKNVLVPLGDNMLWLKDNVIIPLAAVLKDILGIAFDNVSAMAKSLWENVLIPLGAFFTESFQPAVGAISAEFDFLWKKVLKPFGEFLAGILKPAFAGLTDTIVWLWDNVLKPLITFLSGTFKNTFNTVFESIGKIIDGLKTTFIGLMTFITGVFTGDWKKAWEGVKGIFKGVFDTLYEVVKLPLNLIISGINNLIDGLNKIKIDIPDIPGVPGRGTKFGISIPKLTPLANGGITNGPMAALIGDNTGGREVVSPLSDLTDMIQSAVATAVLAASQMTNNAKQPDILISIDGTTFARVTAPYTARESSRIGGAMITTI